MGEKLRQVVDPDTGELIWTSVEEDTNRKDFEGAVRVQALMETLVEDERSGKRRVNNQTPRRNPRITN